MALSIKFMALGCSRLSALPAVEDTHHHDTVSLNPVSDHEAVSSKTNGGFAGMIIRHRGRFREHREQFKLSADLIGGAPRGSRRPRNQPVQLSQEVVQPALREANLHCLLASRRSSSARNFTMTSSRE